jgi:hypothetical protein
MIKIKNPCQVKSPIIFDKFNEKNLSKYSISFKIVQVFYPVGQDLIKVLG